MAETHVPTHPLEARGDGPPGPSPFSGLPKAPPNDPDFFRQLAGLQAEFGDVVKIGFPGLQRYIVLHPDDVQHVLQENYRNYTKDCFEYSMLRLALGRGLVTSDGDLWRRQRQLSAPAFTPKRVATFAPTMTAATSEMLDRWAGVARRGEAIDLVPEMMDVTLRIVANALFGFATEDESREIAPAFGVVMELLMSRSPLSPPLWLPTPANLRFRRGLGVLHRIVDAIIDARRREPGDRGDLLSGLMAARDEETGAAMDDELLRDEVLTLLLAGHETTAMALTWCAYRLSGHPDVRRKLQHEVDTSLAGRTPGFGDVGALSYTRMVIDESMRLHPPVWAIARVATEADAVGGYPVAPGRVLFLSPYATHRHPEFWPNPEGFDPERFTPEAVRERHRFAYFPFAAGARVCIGNTFALLEAQLILAMIAQRFEIDLEPGRAIEPQALVTMRPRDGLWVRLRAR